ncbi:hypothetical protein BST61_g8369 [Cercospora zeina]
MLSWYRAEQQFCSTLRSVPNQHIKQPEPQSYMHQQSFVSCLLVMPEYATKCFEGNRNPQALSCGGRMHIASLQSVFRPIHLPSIQYTFVLLRPL